MTQEKCSKCGAEPRSGSNRWGKECLREAVKRSREKRDDVKHPDVLQARVEAAAVVELGEPSLEAIAGWHCSVCKRLRQAEAWLPPLDERTGWRVLGQDPLGWAEDHGPDFGLPCCRQFSCYDARPGHRAWPPLVAA